MRYPHCVTSPGASLCEVTARPPPSSHTSPPLFLSTPLAALSHACDLFFLLSPAFPFDHVSVSCAGVSFLSDPSVTVAANCCKSRLAHCGPRGGRSTGHTTSADSSVLGRGAGRALRSSACYRSRWSTACFLFSGEEMPRWRAAAKVSWPRWSSWLA